MRWLFVFEPEIILYFVFFAHATHPEAPNAALRGVLERGVGKEETALLIDVKKPAQNLHLQWN